MGLLIQHRSNERCYFYDYFGGDSVKRSEIVKEAENRIISMIDEHEITKKAYEQKNKIIENANDMAREISNGTKAYADNILAGVQVTLEDALKVIENNIFNKKYVNNGYVYDGPVYFSQAGTNFMFGMSIKIQ